MHFRHEWDSTGRLTTGRLSESLCRPIARTIRLSRIPSFDVKNGEETFYKVRQSTQFGKLFQAYADKKGVHVDTIRFLYDVVHVAKDSTPKMLGLEDQDQIDCVLRHLGGFLCLG